MARRAVARVELRRPSSTSPCTQRRGSVVGSAPRRPAPKRAHVGDDRLDLLGSQAALAFAPRRHAPPGPAVRDGLRDEAIRRDGEEVGIADGGERGHARDSACPRRAGRGRRRRSVPKSVAPSVANSRSPKRSARMRSFGQNASGYVAAAQRQHVEREQRRSAASVKPELAASASPAPPPPGARKCSAEPVARSCARRDVREVEARRVLLALARQIRCRRRRRRRRSCGSRGSPACGTAPSLRPVPARPTREARKTSIDAAVRDRRSPRTSVRHGPLGARASRCARWCVVPVAVVALRADAREIRAPRCPVRRRAAACRRARRARGRRDSRCARRSARPRSTARQVGHREVRVAAAAAGVRVALRASSAPARTRRCRARPPSRWRAPGRRGTRRSRTRRVVHDVGVRGEHRVAVDPGFAGRHADVAADAAVAGAAAPGCRPGAAGRRTRRRCCGGSLAW